MGRCFAAVTLTLVILGNESRSAVITVPLDGSVTTVDPVGTAWGVSIGDEVTGSFSFDPAQTTYFPSASTPISAVYLTQQNSPISFSLNIGGINFPSSPSGLLGYSMLAVGVANDISGPSSNPLIPNLSQPADILLLAGFVVTPLAPGLTTSQSYDFRLSLIDYSASVLNSFAVPSQINLADFDEARFSMTDVSLNLVIGPRLPAVTGVIGVPEASPILLSVIGLVAFLLVHLARKSSGRLETSRIVQPSAQ